ncbi:MAG: M10 family metallopeptidase C-terminal domain-containing protein [Hyphomicrobiales bacterium]
MGNYVIGPNNSFNGPGTALTDPNGGKLTVKEKGFLVSTDSHAVSLGISWTIAIHGAIGTHSPSILARGISLPTNDAIVSTINVGPKGKVFSDSGIAIYANHQVTIVNEGKIAGGTTSIDLWTGHDKVINSGKIDGNVSLGGGNDSFINFQKIDGKVKHGTVDGFINLGEGHDVFKGGNKAEWVEDGPGSDLYYLGGGSDRYIATVFDSGDNPDTVDGGKGIDTYDASLATAAVRINLDKVDHDLSPINNDAFTSAGTAITGGAGIGVGTDKIKNFENVIGGSASDAIYGNAAANKLEGRGGGDNLFGYGGNDTLIGGDGSDALAGGKGKDTLWGGNGGGAGDGVLDWFQFFKTSDSGLTKKTRDVIMDFETGLDKIDVSFIDANTKNGTGTNDAFSFVGYGPFNKNPGEIKAVNQGNDTLVQGDVNGDGKADFSILLKDFTFTLFSSDFIL